MFGHHSYPGMFLCMQLQLLTEASSGLMPRDTGQMNRTSAVWSSSAVSAFAECSQAEMYMHRQNLCSTGLAAHSVAVQFHL